MRRQWFFILAVCVALATVACDNHLGGPRKAAADVQGILAVGANHSDFVRALQDFSAAVVLARQEGAADDACRPYTDALGAYMDGKKLWEKKIACPSAFDPSQELQCPLWGARVLAETTLEDIAQLAAKYGVAYDRSAESAWREELRDAKDERSLTSIKFPAKSIQRANAEAYERLMPAIWTRAAKFVSGR